MGCVCVGVRGRGWGVWSWVRSFPLCTLEESPALQRRSHIFCAALAQEDAPGISGRSGAASSRHFAGGSFGSSLGCGHSPPESGWAPSAGCSQARGAVLPPPPPPRADPRRLRAAPLPCPCCAAPAERSVAHHCLSQLSLRGMGRGKLIPPDHPNPTRSAPVSLLLQ